MNRFTSGHGKARGSAHPEPLCTRTVRPRKRGVILLAVLVFVAMLLPLVTLVLTSINTESVATAEAIKGAKSEMAAEKAVNDAISLLVQEKAYPAFYTSVEQSSDAIIVYDGATGYRRDEIPDQGADGAAGEDDQLGTSDDYWIGPRLDGSHIGALDNESHNRMYRYDFRYPNMHGPTYLGQSWSFSTDYLNEARSPYTSGANNWIWLLNQYAAVEVDTDGDDVDDGYDTLTPFNGNDAWLHGPGYYTGADEPRDGGGQVVRDMPQGDNSIEDFMYNAKVNIYQSIYTDLDRGPIPTSLLKSFANVTDEAGRLNLNIFCKKVRVYMPESAETDYDLEGYGTNDFNINGVTDEEGWKWMDNPLFPDRMTTHKWDFNTSTGTFTAGPDLIDWGRFDAATGWVTDDQDDVAMVEMGESAQHYYEGDTDGDGIPQSVEACRNSLNMLMTLPGVTPRLAAEILTYLNPPHDADNADPDSDPWVANAGTYPTLHFDLNDWVSNLPYSLTDDRLRTDYSYDFPDRRVDACNLTPALMALNISTTGSGVVDEFNWVFDFTNEDDMPLPQPRPLTSLDNLRGLPSMTDTIYERLKDKVTVFSYDTNVIANYIQDVSSDADLVNAYVAGDPEYNGSAILREVTEEYRDTDHVADLRFDVDRFIDGFTQADFIEAASEMYAHVREHLPKPLKDKVTLPVVDRMGRSTDIDSYTTNTDPIYDLSDPANPSVLIPHRDTDPHPWNVGSNGHQYEVAGLDGAGYPALNPSFSLDSCLSIVMYRNGSYFQSDDYSYNPDTGAGASDPWPASANRGFGDFIGLGAPWLAGLLGPWASFLESNNNPYSFAGENVDPVVLPHGAGTFRADSMLKPGEFDSVADVLDVPLYEFRNMSVSLMADPPSGFRFDLNGNGDVDTGIPEEGITASEAVNYYISFSDVVDLSWYNTYVNPDGPDGEADTADDLTSDQLSTPLYYMYFTVGNRPGLDWSPDSSDLTAVIPITPLQLRAIGGGNDGGSTKVTIQAYDNFNNIDMLSTRFTDSSYFGTYVRSGWGALGSGGGRQGGWGSLNRRFGWDDVPEQDTGTPDADSRPLENSYWNSGSDNDPDYSGPQFSTPTERNAWAFDYQGDPYLTARVEVRKMDPTASLTEVGPNERTDEVCQVYLQYNEEADIPFMVNILPVRISGSQFEVRSSYGGAETNGGIYLLYDWEYDGSPDSYDGTYPVQSWQTGDPRIIRITPEDTGGVGTVSVQLRLYDLRAFYDDVGGVGYLPLLPGDSTDPATPGFGPLPAVVVGDEVQPAPTFPASAIYGGTHPPENAVGYAEDVDIVNAIPYTGGLVSQVAVDEPAVWDDDTTVQVHCSAAGGELPYTYRMRVLRASYGAPGGGTPYQGPDGFGDITSWPEGFAAIPRNSRVTSGAPYDASDPNSIVYTVTDTVDDVDRTFTINPDALGMDDGDGLNAPYDGEYWVELQVADNSGTAIDHAYTQITVGADQTPSGSTGIPPSMNASINLYTLGENRKGFVCSAGVDGGEGGYSYRWEVHRPVYAASGSQYVAEGTEIVDSNHPYVSIDATNAGVASGRSVEMVSNEQNPSFEFHTQDVYDNNTGGFGGDGIPDADGVYFVHLYVMDNASSSPSYADCSMAHDVAMVTISDTGLGVSDPPSTSRLARTPMALLHAYPPGNTSTEIGANPMGTGGSNQPWIGSVTTAPAISPDVAGAGDVIVIRGYNFAASTSVASPDYIPGVHINGSFDDNYVTFGGGATATPLTILDDGVTLEIPAGGPAYQQMAMYVRVPEAARTGYLTVTTPQGTSQRVFFQTGFDVTFDLIGKMSPNDPTYLLFELDYQGDGRIDYSYNSLTNTDGPGQVRGASHGITHDYASDGIGNYIATLYVTDLVSGRRATDHQMVTIRDLNPNSQRGIQVTAGTMTSLAGSTFTDNEADFVVANVIAGDEVYNTTQGEVAAVLARTSSTVLELGTITGGPGLWAPDDSYEIRRWLTYDDDQGANALICSIWPELESRYESFTADSEDGVTFQSSVGGASGVERKWQIDLNGNPGGGVGGELVYSGTATATDLSGVTLVDASADFENAGRLGVREDDLVILDETDSNGTPPPPYATSNVDEVVSATTLTMQHPADSSQTVGLDNGSNITRLGTVTSVNTGVAGATYVIEDNNYDWVGDGASLAGGVTMGGILADDTPATPGIGDTIYNLDNDYSQWLVVDDYLSDPTLAADQVRLNYTGAAVATTAAQVNAILATNPGADATVTLNIAAVAGWVGSYLHNDTSGGTWLIIAIVGANDIDIVNAGGSGTVNLGDLLRINPVSGGAQPPAWDSGADWRVDIPANEIRIGMDYSIYTDNGFQTTSWADATYATTNAPIDFTINMTYPFDLSNSTSEATLVYIDWDNDGVIDTADIYAVGDTTRLDGAVNGMEVESLKVTHTFGAPYLNGTAARYYVEVLPLGVATSSIYPGWPPSVGGGYALPEVIVGGDDFGSSDLTRLRVANWNRDAWHQVTFEASYSVLSSLLDDGWVSGTSNQQLRYFYASDQLLVPPGLQDYEDTQTTWVSYSKPFMSSNNIGVTTMRHQAIHGVGGAYNWLSDANADTKWTESDYESPQGNNPSNHYEYIFQNGMNQMTLSGVTLSASFPTSAEGIGRNEVSGSWVYYRSDRGIYNGFGYISDELDAANRTFNFDNQPVFLGDSLSLGTSTGNLGLAADFEIQPIVGTNFENLQLTGYATGGSTTTSYDYYWYIEKTSGAWTGMVGLGKTYDGTSSEAGNPVFNPYSDVSDEPGAANETGEGTYRVWLIVEDGLGTYTTCLREFEVLALEPSVHVMADPPSGTTGGEIQYHVYVEGGVPPYQIDIDFDNDGTVDRSRTVSRSTVTVFSNVYYETGDYTCRVEMFDSDTTDPDPALADDTATTVVSIAEQIPLNANLMVNPPSGVAPFLCDVYYAVSGGDPFSNNTYNVSVQLINVDGDAGTTVSRNDANTFGSNGIPDDPRLPTSDDEPVQLVIPAAGNYTVSLTVTDNTGRVKSRSESVFASGYLLTHEYGDDTPEVVRDKENRPMHAVRIWTDPFLNIGDGVTDGYDNVMDYNSFSGGRLMEADLQVLGDLFTVDPNPSFRSRGLNATKDPLDQPVYYTNYSLSTSGEESVQDFYDTYTMGRININTADEDTLTALFMLIRSNRAYDYEQDLDLYGTGDQTYRVVANPAGDTYLTEAQARQLAQKVIRYRTAYYDLHKPAVPDANDEFGYVPAAGVAGLGGDFRVDHLPVIGPFDGVNPHEYAIDERNNDLQAPDNSDDELNNAWDHMAATYYNFDNGNPLEMFYSPSDIAVVRDRWTMDIDLNILGNTVNIDYSEPESNYAKYLNDVMHNQLWEDNRTGEMGDWAGTGQYQADGDNYSDWAFDARNYFTYDGAEIDVSVTITSPTSPPVITVNSIGGGGAPEDARNNIAIIDSNGVTAYTYIPNPPFRHLFDLYKVIDNSQLPDTFSLDSTGGGGSIRLEGATEPDYDYSYTNQVFSGPSAFRYVARWDDERCEFLPVANYLDDIAPYVTCRSYVFRVEANGAVTASGGVTGAVVDTARISRDRSKMAIVDVGPLWARRDNFAANDLLSSFGLTTQDKSMSYRVLWYTDNTE